jgi:hypothetical protein
MPISRMTSFNPHATAPSAATLALQINNIQPMRRNQRGCADLPFAESAVSADLMGFIDSGMANQWYQW